MSIRPDYQPLAFGLDEVSGSTTPRPGRLIGCQNFELVFGDDGLRRINGYEAFDGRASPSAAVIYRIAFEDGTAAISVGQTVTSAGGSARVLRVALESGSYGGGDAAGYLVVTALTGTFTATENLQVSAVTKAVCAGFEEALAGDDGYATDIADARDYYRGLIAAPTGDGAILGVAVWGSTVFCMRNATGGATATLWRSSASGWVAVKTGLRPGGAMRGHVANFVGDSQGQCIYLVDGLNQAMRVDASWAFSFAPATIYSTEAVSTNSITPGLGSKNITTNAGRAWTNGQELIVYGRNNAANYMIGTVTASGTNDVTINVTSFGGTTDNNWAICLTSGLDRPYLVTEHKNYLMLGYPGGQLQTSDVGEPFLFGTTSEAFGLGAEIQDLRALRGDVLGVFLSNGVSLLYGDGSTANPFTVKKHSSTNGALRGSSQEVGGDAVYVSAAGVHSLAATQAFGDFAYTNIGEAARRALERCLTDYKCTAYSNLDAQYRIYGANGAVLVMTVYGAPSAKTVRFTRLVYPDQAVCAASAPQSDGTELMVFGTDSGMVMRDRIGTTFNGADIEAFFRTSYWHSGSPQTRKRYRKLILDVETGRTSVTLMFRQDIDFYGVNQAEAQAYDVSASGGYYDVSFFNEFFWDGDVGSQVHASIDGVGRHMSIVVHCEGDYEPFIVRGMHTLFSPLGTQR